MKVTWEAACWGTRGWPIRCWHFSPSLDPLGQSVTSILTGYFLSAAPSPNYLCTWSFSKREMKEPLATDIQFNAYNYFRFGFSSFLLTGLLTLDTRRWNPGIESKPIIDLGTLSNCEVALFCVSCDSLQKHSKLLIHSYHLVCLLELDMTYCSSKCDYSAGIALNVAGQIALIQRRRLSWCHCEVDYF